MKFSLCMIVKNEEKSLPECLQCVKNIFDEIVIVDTGSSDRTKIVAHAFTDKIYDFPWCDDFSAARNFSFSKATGDYIAWLDADDRLDEANRTAFAALKQTLSFETDVVMMKYAAAFHADGSPAFYYYRERLVKRMAHFTWQGFVHEVIVPKGSILYSDICVFHKPHPNGKAHSDRNLKLYESKLAAGYLLGTRDIYYYARELFDHANYDLAARHLLEFLDRSDAWYADKIGACILLYRIHAAKDPLSAKPFLCKALGYERITPQILCLLGDDCRKNGLTEQAIFWYKAALVCPKEYRKDGFVNPDFEVYYPALSLCVCYDTLGERQTAAGYNSLAETVHPSSPEVAYNKSYFASFIQPADTAVAADAVNNEKANEESEENSEENSKENSEEHELPLTDTDKNTVEFSKNTCKTESDTL